MVSKNLERYIHTEDDEAAGAKKGYVKDKEIAEDTAEFLEQINDLASPEELNRKAEGNIGRMIAEKEALRNIKSSIAGSNLDYFHENPDRAGLAMKEDISEGKKVGEEYKEFVKRSDSEELDRLRKKMREEGQN
ncbi:MAG: hypothetical protein Q7S53_03755 [bacterium]|nr:hypothetical protein [bacterium]